MKNKKLFERLLLAEMLVFYAPTLFYLLVGLFLVPHQILLMLNESEVNAYPILMYLAGGYIGFYVMVSSWLDVKSGRSPRIKYSRAVLTLLALAGILVGPLSEVVNVAGDDWISDLVLWVILPMFAIIHLVYASATMRLMPRLLSPR